MRAVRSCHTVHGRYGDYVDAKVTVYFDDGRKVTAGGARAARANYAIVYQSSPGHWGFIGLRKDARGDGRNQVAIPIEEGEQS